MAETTHIAHTSPVVYSAFNSPRVQNYIQHFRKRYNETLAVRYKGMMLFGDISMHHFQVDIDVLGIDFHRTFAITELMEENKENYTAVIMNQLKKAFAMIPEDVMTRSKEPS